jgi:hypothetical protein
MAQSRVTYEDQTSYAVKLKQQLNELTSAIQNSKTLHVCLITLKDMIRSC